MKAFKDLEPGDEFIVSYIKDRKSDLAKCEEMIEKFIRNNKELIGEDPISHWEKGWIRDSELAQHIRDDFKRSIFVEFSLQKLEFEKLINEATIKRMSSILKQAV